MLELEGEELARFGGKFAREFLEHVLAETAHHGLNGVFALDATAFEVEQLVFADTAGRSFVLGLGARVRDRDVGERVGGTLGADEHAVALGVVAGACGGLADAHFATVGVAGVVRADTLRNDRALGVLADVDHLRAGVSLHVAVREGHAVEFTDGVVALQNAARVLPRDGRSRFDLRPADAAVLASALAALGDEVVHATGTGFTVAGVPVLHGRILDFGVFLSYEFHDGAVELLARKFGGGAAFEVAHASVVIGDDQCAFELACFLVVDAEVGGKVHGALDSRRNVHKASVAKDCAVEGRKVVVASGDHATKILFNEFRVFLDGIADGAEDDAHFHEFLLVARVNTDGVEHGIDGYVCESLLFVERDAELFKSRQEFRIHVFNFFVALLGLRCGVIDDVLQIDGVEVEFAPVGLFHRLELFVGSQAEIEHELWFATER